MTAAAIGNGPEQIGYDAADALWILDMLNLAEAQSMTMGTEAARLTRRRIAQYRAAVAARAPVPILTPEMPYAWYAIVTALATATDHAVRLSGSAWSMDRRIMVAIDGHDHELTRVYRDAEAERDRIASALKRIVDGFASIR